MYHDSWIRNQWDQRKGVKFTDIWYYLPFKLKLTFISQTGWGISVPSKILILGTHLELKHALAVISTINFFISAGFFIENLQNKYEIISCIFFFFDLFCLFCFVFFVTHIFSEAGVTRSLALCVVFCRSLFVLFLLAIVLSVFLRFTDFDYLPLVSSNSSWFLAWFMMFVFTSYFCKMWVKIMYWSPDDELIFSEHFHSITDRIFHLNPTLIFQSFKPHNWLRHKSFKSRTFHACKWPW